jgi:hypothetical protein
MVERKNMGIHIQTSWNQWEWTILIRKTSIMSCLFHLEEYRLHRGEVIGTPKEDFILNGTWPDFQ